MIKTVGSIAVVCTLAWAILHAATQGMHEDAIYVSALSGARPIFWRARGFADWSLWMQIQHGVTPFAVRAWNLIGAFGVAGLVGLLASRLGLSGWIASAVMLVHPLTIETLMTMSGRYELIAAIGVLFACLGATLDDPIQRAGLILLGVGVGWLGKQTAIVGLPLAALIWWTQERTPRSVLVFVGAIVGVLVVAWHSRLAGQSQIAPGSPLLTWALLQATAAWRLITLAMVPIGQTPDYDYDRVRLAWQIASAASLGVVGVLALSLWPIARVLAMSLAWMLVVCLPRLIVQTPKSYLNEHQFYLALVGVSLAIAGMMQQAERRACAIA